LKTKNKYIYCYYYYYYLIRGLGLTKGKSEFLGSRLKEKNLLMPAATFYWYRNHEKELQRYYTNEGQLVLCSDIPNIAHQLGKE
jgi:hypothetical protein